MHLLAHLRDARGRPKAVKCVQEASTACTHRPQPRESAGVSGEGRALGGQREGRLDREVAHQQIPVRSSRAVWRRQRCMWRPSPTRTVVATYSAAAENMPSSAPRSSPTVGMPPSKRTKTAHPLPKRWAAQTDRGGDDERVDTQRDDERRFGSIGRPARDGRSPPLRLDRRTRSRTRPAGPPTTRRPASPIAS